MFKIDICGYWFWATLLQLNVCTYIMVLIVQHLGVGVEKRDEKGAEESSVEGDAG